MLRWLAALVVAVSLSASQSAFALGLGEITTRSALNEPMQAEISLLGATREELTGLEIRLASAETFDRYGIDKPSYLNGLRFRIRGGDKPTVTVTSSQPITEPFVTMLVEAVWPRGRLLREYTVLLDPPTYSAPTSAAPPPRTAPAAPRRSASAGTIQRAPAASSRAPIDGNQYRVQRNDTLWEIAARIQPDQSVSINQVMLAIYQANPGAFAGNINRLNAGAVLNLPSQESLYAINRTRALEEVRRQNQDWRGGGGTLKLVEPEQGSVAGGVSDRPSDATSSTGSATNAAELAQLQRDLAEKERLLALKNEELARLQALLGQSQEETGAIEEPVSTQELYGEDTSAPVDEQPVETPTEPAAEIFVDNTESTDLLTDAPVEDTPVEDAPVDEPAEADPQPSARTPTVVVPAPEPGFLSKVFGSIWAWVGLGVAAVLGLLALLAGRRSDDGDPTGTWESLDAADLEDLDGTLAATGRLRELGSRPSSSSETAIKAQPAIDDPFESTAPVDESVAPEKFVETIAPDTPDIPDTPEEPGYSIEDTFSSDTAINLDQSDPLAEADFHMAYGLYDQAADLIKGALAVDSSDDQLKAKLCEIYFVWGNQDGFVEAASELKKTLPDGDPEWNKVVIMGQQIAPAHALFSGAVASSGDADLDLSLDGETSIGAQIGSGETGGFKEVFDNPGDGGTVEQLADMSGVDFEFDEQSLSDDNLMVDDHDTVNTEGLDFQVDGDSDGGTVEQPIDLGAPDGFGSTEEIDIADLDLDTEGLGEALDATSGDVTSDLLEATGVTSVLPDDFKVSLPGDDDATVLARSDSFDLDGIDDDATGTAQMPSFDDDDEHSTSITGIMPAGGIAGDVDLDVADLTSELGGDDVGADEDATMQQPAIEGSSTLFSEQVFGGDDDVDSAADTGLNLALDDTGETNIAEVGTKLDLARAYVDMGDPDGARSILEEVLTEGDEGQREEAKALLDSLT